MGVWTPKVEMAFGYSFKDAALPPYYSGDTAGFEGGTSGNWVRSGTTPAPAITFTTTLPYHGTKSAVFNLPTGGGGRTITQFYPGAPESPLVVGKVYTVSIAIKVNSGPSWSLGISDGITPTGTLTTTTTGVWQVLTGTFTANAPTNMPVIWPTAGTLIGQSANVDGLQMYIGTTIPTYPVIDTGCWTDVTQYVLDVGQIKVGRSTEVDRVETGTGNLILDNGDYRWTPDKSSSPYYPNLVPNVPVRITSTNGTLTNCLFYGVVERWPLDVNSLVGEMNVPISDVFKYLSDTSILEPIRAYMISQGADNYWPLDGGTDQNTTQQYSYGNWYSCDIIQADAEHAGDDESNYDWQQDVGISGGGALRVNPSSRVSTDPDRSPIPGAYVPSGAIVRSADQATGVLAKLNQSIVWYWRRAENIYDITDSSGYGLNQFAFSNPWNLEFQMNAAFDVSNKITQGTPPVVEQRFTWNRIEFLNFTYGYLDSVNHKGFLIQFYPSIATGDPGNPNIPKSYDVSKRQWMQFAFTVDGSGFMKFYVDGVEQVNYTYQGNYYDGAGVLQPLSGTTTSLPTYVYDPAFDIPTKLDIGGVYSTVDGDVGYPTAGNLAQLGIFDGTVFTAAELVQMKTNLVNGFIGDTEIDRLERVFTLGNIPTSWLTYPYGKFPKTQLRAARWADGSNILSVSQETVENALGILYPEPVPAGPRIAYQHRHSKLNVTTSSTTLEPPEPGYIFQMTDTALMNDVQITRFYGGTFTEVDNTSIGRYGRKTAAFNLDVASDINAKQAAQWLLYLHKDPKLRIDGVKILLSTLPQVNIDALMVMKLGQRITIDGFPAVAPVTTMDFFVESIKHEIKYDGSTPTWYMSLDLSPVSPITDNTFFILDHATLGKLDSGNKLPY